MTRGLVQSTRHSQRRFRDTNTNTNTGSLHGPHLKTPPKLNRATRATADNGEGASPPARGSQWATEAEARARAPYCPRSDGPGRTAEPAGGSSYMDTSAGTELAES